MSEIWLDGLREICLAFPETAETGGVGNPSFKVRDKIFAMQHGHDERGDRASWRLALVIGNADYEAAVPLDFAPVSGHGHLARVRPLLRQVPA